MIVPAPALTPRTPHFVCQVSDLAPGQRLIVEVGGRSVGVFNIAGQYFALHNRCPHAGGELCRGPLTNTPWPTSEPGNSAGQTGPLIICNSHGWEFEVATGRCLTDPNYRARIFPVTVADGQVTVHV